MKKEIEEIENYKLQSAEQLDNLLSIKIKEKTEILETNLNKFEEDSEKMLKALNKSEAEKSLLKNEIDDIRKILQEQSKIIENSRIEKKTRKNYENKVHDLEEENLNQKSLINKLNFKIESLLK